MSRSSGAPLDVGAEHWDSLCLVTVIPQSLVGSFDQRVQLSVDWKGFEQFLELRGDSNATRVAYLDGRLEIMSPCQGHEIIKKRIARLLEAWAEENDVDLDGVGSWTIKDPAVEAGGEADECYLLGSREGAERPDLAIEVNWSRRGLNKLEVWRRRSSSNIHTSRTFRLRVFTLRASGEAYDQQDRSALLPTLDLGLLSQFVAIRSQLLAVKSFRAALRDRR